MMTIACPSCAAQLQIPPALAGKTVACPKCKTKIRLEAPAPASSPPPSAPPSPAADFAFAANSPSAPPTPAKPKPKAQPKPAPIPAPDGDFDWADGASEPEPGPGVAPKSKKRRPDPEPEADDEEPPQKRVDKKKPASKKRPKEPAGSNRLLWMGIAGGGSLAALLLIGGVLAWSLSGSTAPAKVAVAPKLGLKKAGGKGEQVAKMEQEAPAIKPLVVPPGPDLADASGPLPASLAAEAMLRVKKATAFIKVTADDNSMGSGSGWFGLKGGTVVTNAHVVGMKEPYTNYPKKLEVIINSGLADEKVFTGQVLGVDRENDLALVSVSGQAKDWPEPLPISKSDQLTELQDVIVFGFPLGASLGRGSSLGPEITVARTTISAFRRNDVGNLRLVQVAGGLEHGNSGGPIVDTRGAVIGVSVSGVDGTSIKFAVPGDKVRELVNGRVADTRIYEPFKDGNTVRLPVKVETLDPLRRIKDVNVEVWAGAPGKPRPGSMTPPAKKDGDGPHTIVEARLETETAMADVDMPQLGKDQVIWVQPVVTDEQGRKLWGVAESMTPNGLPPLERTPVAFNPTLDRPTERTVEVRDTTNRRALGGLSERDISTSVVEAKILEKIVRKGKGVAVDWFPGEVQREEKDFEGKVTKSAPALSNALKQLPLGFVLDGYGQMSNRTIRRPSATLAKKVRDDCVLVMSAFSNTFQTTLMNPPADSNEIRPTTFWLPRPTRVTLSQGNYSEPVLFVSTWTYEGIRMHEGRRRAYCRIDGYLRGATPFPAVFSGALVEGHVHFDLEDGYIAESKMLVKCDLDGGSLNLGLELKRTPGNTYSIVPESAGPDPLAKMKKVKSLTARLDPNDPKLSQEIMDKIEVRPEAKPAPFPFKAYSLKLEKGKTYIIDMVRIGTPRAEDQKFDPLLLLQDKDMKIVEQDDDSLGDLNSRIVFNCKETETYRLIASCMPPHVASDFRIDVSIADGSGSVTLEPEP
jgi:S1-C subfamily serine protease